MHDRSCGWCRGPIPETARRDSKFCSKSCRQASHRFGKGAVRRERADQPLRLAYADPPYPGLASYYLEHPDYAGEVDHAELAERLKTYDGWALSTNARSLPKILALLGDVDVRIAAWVRGPRPARSCWPLSAWEPVVFAGGRREPSRTPGVDVLTHGVRPRTTDPDRVIGAKPAAFAYWLFDLLGARPGDQLDDLYPGRGGIARAWSRYTAAAHDTSARAPDDASRGSAHDVDERRVAGIPERPEPPRRSPRDAGDTRRVAHDVGRHTA